MTTIQTDAFDAGRVRDTLLTLGDAVRDLNEASDVMNAHIASIDASLKALGCGVAAWVTLVAGGEGTPNAHERSLGYAKVNGRWCLAMRQSRGIRGSGEYKEDLWPFTEAARWMRAESVHRLPDLLDAMLRNVKDMTDKMHKKSELVKEFANAMQEAGDAKSNK